MLVAMTRRQFQRQHRIEHEKLLSATVRKHLNADALFKTVRNSFAQVAETRTGKPQISVSDALMSAFAMFSLKDPSLLAFDDRRKEEPHNLKMVYGIKEIPCDTQMRSMVDPVPPDELRPAHNGVIQALQRGKAFEKMEYLDEGYLLPLDGTGYFSSEKLFSDACMKKESSTGKITYYLQMLGAAIVHPERAEVIPMIPEIISRQDGSTKNDCEINASKRFIVKLRNEHPHFKIVVTQDAISPNGPYIRFLTEMDCRFILNVKETDHAHLFARFDQAVDAGTSGELIVDDPKKPERFHYFRWVSGLPINASHPDVLVNFLEYHEVTGDETKRFCWVTDIPLSQENVYRIMRAGRARWKIENETFNTLKNQGYHLEHNYGLGEKYLCMNFPKIMMLAFLVDQAQQLCCALFQSVLKKFSSKKLLWDRMRSLFYCFQLDSMEMLYRALLCGFVKTEPIIVSDTS
jgi:hypothetical protein